MLDRLKLEPKKVFMNGTASVCIIEGTTEKVLQFIMPLNSIYYKTLDFIKPKMYF
jgi:hypothetical protein